MTDSSDGTSAAERAAGAAIELERDVFLRTLVRELAGTLEDVVGIDEASGFISVVGQRVGEWIRHEYASELGESWDRHDVAAVLVDLKRRIQGDFAIESISEDAIVLRNKACPFGDKVLGRPSMCMMTSNVFGYVASESLGYARVALDETIAEGGAGCRVTVHLRPKREALSSREREYFGEAAADGER